MCTATELTVTCLVRGRETKGQAGWEDFPNCCLLLTSFEPDA